MRKRNILSLLLTFVTMTISAQSTVGRVEISEDQSDPEEVSYDCCTLYVTSAKSRNPGEVSLIVEIENADQSDKSLLLFGESFTEKDLKKNTPSIRFHKTYGAMDKNVQIIDGIRGGNRWVEVKPGRKETLSFDNFSDSKLELPLYIAKYKPKGFLRKEKYMILEGAPLTLYVKVIPDESDEPDDLEKLNKAYDDLMNDLEGKSFCPNKRHSPGFKEQIKPYKEKKENALEKIAEIRESNGWRENSKEYKPYKELKGKFENIDFNDYKRDCGRHGGSTPPLHQCAYCDWSIGSVQKSLENTYIKLTQGKVTKAKALSTANELKRAWSGGCPNLKKKKSAKSTMSNNIDRYYNSIANY